jgi:hypothetical protein
MATITDVVIETEDSNSRKKVTYTVILTDNDGGTRTHKIGPINGDSDYDPIAQAPAIGISVLAGFESDEEAQAEAAIETGDTLTLTLNPKWSSSKRIAKRLIRYMMRQRDPRIVIALEPLIQYLKANYNATQMANFLDITTAQVLKLNRRVNAILQDSGTVKAQLTVFDQDLDEIE